MLGSSFPSQDVELRALLYYNLQPDGLDTLHLYAGFAKVSYRVKSAESPGFIIGYLDDVLWQVRCATYSFMC